MASEMSGPWSFELGDASETAVRAAVAVLKEGGVEADAVDSSQWLTWHLDRSSVESLEAGLRAGLTVGNSFDARTAAALRSLLAECQCWLGDDRSQLDLSAPL